MTNIDRFLELAGLKEKSFKTKPLNESSLDELLLIKECLESEISSSIYATEQINNKKLELTHINKELEDLSLEGIDEHLKQVDGKWAIVSKKTGRPLRYYKGEGKPSDEWVTKQEKSIQYFKNMGESVNINAVTPEDQNKSKLIYDVEKMQFKYVTDEPINEGFGGEELQDLQPSSAVDKNKVDSIFGKDEHTDNKPEMDSRLGIAQDERTPVEVPKDVLMQVDMRIKELKDSMNQYDRTTYSNQYSNKQKTIDSLEFIKEKLKDCNMENFKEIQIYYSSLTSLFTQLFPAKLIDFIHDGMGGDSREEVATTSYMDGDKDKKKEGQLPNNAIYKPKSDPIYPQTDGSDQKPK